MKNYFEGSVIVITGGASGIGREMARQLAMYSATVIMVDRDMDKGELLVSKLRSEGYSAEFMVGEMTDLGTVKTILDEVLRRHAKIDYMINAAGIFMGGEMRDTSIADIRKVTENNIMAIMNGSQSAYDIMRRQKHGHIINLGSVAGLAPIPAMGIYGATKYAINGYTLALRNEAHDQGIKVSLVCPTIVDTPLYDTAIYNNVKKDKALARRKSFQRPEVAARRIVRGIVRNRATIHTSLRARLVVVLYRIAPGLYDIMARRITAQYRRELRDI